jgi:hypothetical protein
MPLLVRRRNSSLHALAVGETAVHFTQFRLLPLSRLLRLSSPRFSRRRDGSENSWIFHHRRTLAVGDTAFRFMQSRLLPLSRLLRLSSRRFSRRDGSENSWIFHHRRTLAVGETVFRF